MNILFDMLNKRVLVFTAIGERLSIKEILLDQHFLNTIEIKRFGKRSKKEEHKNFQKYQMIDMKENNLMIVVKDSNVDGIFMQVLNKETNEILLFERIQNTYEQEVAKLTSICWSGEIHCYPSDTSFKCRWFSIGRIHKNK